MAQKITGLQIESTSYAYGEVSSGNTTVVAKSLAGVVSSGITYNGTNTFTVTVKGLYFIQAQQLMEANTGVYFQININGSTVRHAYHNGGAAYVRDLMVSEMRVLNVGDTISFGQQNNSLTTWGGAHSSFQIFLVKRTA